MAVAARQVQVTVGDDHAVKVEKEIIVDHERGVVAEVEKTAVAVDLGDGRVGVATQQKVVGVRVGGQAKPAAPQYQQQPQQVTIVRKQPVVINQTVVNTNGKSAEDSAFVLAVCAVFLNCFCCWWAFLCSFPAVVFALNASSAQERGDAGNAVTNRAMSVLCSVIALFTGILGLAVVIALIRSQL